MKFIYFFRIMIEITLTLNIVQTTKIVKIEKYTNKDNNIVMHKR